MTLFARKSALGAGFLALILAGGLATGSLHSMEQDQLRSQSGGVDRQVLLEDLHRLRAIRPHVEDSLLDLPGVIGFGIGRVGDQLVFSLLVDRSAPLPDVPAELGGVPLQVLRRDPVRVHNGYPACGIGGECHDDPQPLPVEMGNSASPSNRAGAGACTLGFKACDLGTSELVFVTNSHCNQNKTSCNQHAIGSLWVHPGWMDTPTETCLQHGTCEVIGTSSGDAEPVCGSNNNLTDATKVASAFDQTSNAVRDIGFLNAFEGDLVPGELIRRSSRTSGYGEGRLLHVDLDIEVTGNDGFCCGDLWMHDQIEWEPINGSITQDGDSGSALIGMESESHNQVVGLHFGGSDNLGYANRIDHVLDALNISLNLVSCMQECLYTFTENMAEQELGTEPGLFNLGHRFREQVMTRTPEGREMIQMYYRISDEAVGIAARNPGLAWDTAKLLADMAPQLEELVVRGETRITPAELDRIDQLIATYAEKSSEGMGRILDTVRERLYDTKLQRLHGVAVEDAEPGR